MLKEQSIEQWSAFPSAQQSARQFNREQATRSLFFCLSSEVNCTVLDFPKSLHSIDQILQSIAAYVPRLHRNTMPLRQREHHGVFATFQFNPPLTRPKAEWGRQTYRDPKPPNPSRRFQPPQECLCLQRVAFFRPLQARTILCRRFTTRYLPERCSSLQRIILISGNFMYISTSGGLFQLASRALPCPLEDI